MIANVLMLPALLIFSLLFLIPNFCNAAFKNHDSLSNHLERHFKQKDLAYYGFNISYPLIKKEPPFLHGFQFMLNYEPSRWAFRQFKVYFDLGFSHFWINNTPYYTTINIYSVAPIVRYVFSKQGIFLPYLELSIGLSYLNHTRIDNRNLGIHFAFQDRIGIGIAVGNSNQISMGLHAVHYSNARLSSHNSGITVPLMLDLGYRFC